MANKRILNKTVAIIQARMSSSRLPGKVMANIAGKPMLYHVIHRAQKAKTIDLVTVATSDHEEDDIIEKYCVQEGFPCFRGNLNDVLDRYYQSAKHFKAEAIVRLTADCPLLDPDVIDKVVRTFQFGDYDYVSNTLQCTYPDGLDVEIFHFSALERAWREARLKSEREHVTPYIRKHPEEFRLGNVYNEKDLSAHRWTVDESRDLQFVRAIFWRMSGTIFGMEQVLGLIEMTPALREINAGIARNEGYLKSLREDR